MPLKFARSYSPEKKVCNVKKKNFVYRILRLTSQAPRYFKKYSKNCFWTINKWINPAPGVFVVLFNRLRYEKDKHFLKDYTYHFFYLSKAHIKKKDIHVCICNVTQTLERGGGRGQLYRFLGLFSQTCSICFHFLLSLLSVSFGKLK